MKLYANGLKPCAVAKGAKVGAMNRRNGSSERDRIRRDAKDDSDPGARQPAKVRAAVNGCAMLRLRTESSLDKNGSAGRIAD